MEIRSPVGCPIPSGRAPFGRGACLPMSKTPSESTLPPVSVGDLVAGKYRVLSILGSGGMGVVVAARHEELEQLVALKLIRSELGGSGSMAARFLREARAAARIQSDHVARVFDMGALDDGRAFMVMEHLTGSDLAAIVRERGPLPAAEAAGYGLEILEAVAHAHALGIIHRDLKPSNVFLARRSDGTRRIKVLDFGISKDTGAHTGSTPPGALTTGDAVLGSPAYMAPEQVKKSRDADVRSDIWSIGVILYELLAGEPPFQGETVMELLAAILECSPEPLRQRRPEVPGELEGVVMRCLSRSPDQRFQDVASLAAALGPFAPEAKRQLVERIGLILKGEEDRAEGVVRISNPGTPRVSQTAATMAAALEGEAKAEKEQAPQGKEAVSGNATGASWAGASQGVSRGAPWRSIGVGLSAAIALSVVVFWALSGQRGGEPAATPVAPVAGQDTAPIVPGTAAAPATAKNEPVVMPSASAPAAAAVESGQGAPPAVGSAAASASAQHPKASPAKPSAAPSVSSRPKAIPADLLRDRD